MKTRSFLGIKNEYIFTFLIPTAFFISVVIALFQYKNGKIELVQHNVIEGQMQAFSATYDKYKTMSDMLFFADINNDEILPILASNNLSDNQKRDQLLDQFQKEYDVLKKFNVEQLQFHTPNNISFLRLENQDRFGDDLTPFRPSVVYVNREKKAFESFEIGAYVYGYRFVYPLFQNDRYLGSVEMGISTEKFLESLQKLYKGHIYFLLNKNLADGVLHDKTKKDFIPSSLENYYITNDHTKSVLTEMPKDQIKSIEAKISLAKPFTQVYKNNILSFIPIQNKITHNVEGTYFFYIQSDQIKSINNSFQFVLLILTLVFFILYYLLYKLNTYRHSLIQKSHNIRNILDNQDAIVVVTDGVRIKDANKTMYQFFGFKDLGEFVAKHECICEYFESQEGKDYILAKVNNMVWSDYIMENPSKNHLVKMRSFENSEHIFQVSISTFEDNYILNFNDITKQKLLEIELEEINKNLEVTIKDEVEKSKKKDQVIQQQKRLAQMGEMISMIAHQWRQPLASISSSVVTLKLQLALKKFDLTTDVGREELLQSLQLEFGDIENLIQNLTKTIDDFRSFYKSNEEQETFLAKDLLQKVIGTVSLQFGTNHIEVIEEHQATNKVMVFTNDIFKVFFNIFLNSVENFIARDIIENRKIFISSENIDDGVLIKIADNGGGIEEGIMDKIFDPYFSTKNEKNDTGLGLYASKIIIEKYHHGVLSVHNTKDGVCFMIEIKNS